MITPLKLKDDPLPVTNDNTLRKLIEKSGSLKKTNIFTHEENINKLSEFDIKLYKQEEKKEESLKFKSYEEFEQTKNSWASEKRQNVKYIDELLSENEKLKQKIKILTNQENQLLMQIEQKKVVIRKLLEEKTDLNNKLTETNKRFQNLVTQIQIFKICIEKIIILMIKRINHFEQLVLEKLQRLHTKLNSSNSHLLKIHYSIMQNNTCLLILDRASKLENENGNYFIEVTSHLVDYTEKTKSLLNIFNTLFGFLTPIYDFIKERIISSRKNSDTLFLEKNFLNGVNELETINKLLKEKNEEIRNIICLKPKFAFNLCLEFIQENLLKFIEMRKNFQFLIENLIQKNV